MPELSDEQIAEKLAVKLKIWSPDMGSYLDWWFVKNWNPCQSNDQAAMVVDEIGRRWLETIQLYEREIVRLASPLHKPRVDGTWFGYGMGFTIFDISSATPRAKCIAALKAIEAK